MERELDIMYRSFFALSVSMGTLTFHQSGFPSDGTVNDHYDPLLLMASLLTFYLAMASLLIRVAMDTTTTRPPNPTYARWISHSGTATLALCVLLEAYTAFANSTFFSPHTVSWASESGLILLAIAIAIAMAYRVIIKMPTSWFQKYRNIVLFTLCAAIAGSEDFTTSSFIPYDSVMYKTYCIYHFGLVPCSFVLGVLLLIIGIALPDTDSSAAGHFVSVMCKEVFTKFTLSVGSITLLVGAFLTINLLTIGPAVLGGAGVAMAMEVGAI